MLGPTLAGPTVTLAPIKPEHLEHYVDWFADSLVTRFLNHVQAFTLQQEHEWLDRVSRSETEVAWGIFVEGRHIGGAAVSQIDWRSRRGMTGIFIGDRNWWGRGVATEAMTLRTRYAFEELGLEKLITQVVEGNVASRRALEKVGYATVGVYRHHEFRQNRWWDVWIGELLRDDWLADHASLTP
ncbi:MAG: GNAT family N-acetyltransferase [Chloroflexi bacterium]|nr:GNAT family N-acetyltransferase [Chloroflexota bacterium]